MNLGRRVPSRSPASGVAVLPLATLFTILVGDGTTALGQPLFTTVEGIEWMAADSDLIVRGPIVELAGWADDRGGVWRTATLRVAEALKGGTLTEVSFVLLTNADEEELGRWAEGGMEVLAFLVESDRLAEAWPGYAEHDYAPRTGMRSGSVFVLDAGARPEVFTLDLKALAHPDEVLQATKGAIERNPGVGGLRSHLIDLPEAALRGTPWEEYLAIGGGARLIVPADGRLEERARGWIESEDGDLREEGVEALRHFSSDANIALLKGLLDDPATRNVVRHAGGRTVGSDRVYFVRAAAVSALEGWGVDVPRPVLKEPIP